MSDPHRLDVYRAEDEALPDGGRRFARFVELERYVESVVLGDWWGTTFPYAPLQIDVARRSRSATFSAARVEDRGEDQGDVATLWIRDGSWTTATVLHELAHVAAWNLADQAHGVEFTTVLLLCWRRYAGFDAYGALRSGFDRRRVPYHRERLR